MNTYLEKNNQHILMLHMFHMFLKASDLLDFFLYGSCEEYLIKEQEHSGNIIRFLFIFKISEEINRNYFT